MKNKKYFETFIEYLFLLLLGGSIYYGIEILYRGYSHIAMVLVGGLCFIEIGLINELISWDMKFWKQVLIGDVLVLITEFYSGCILNLWLGLNIWDYSNLPFNILGQISLYFAILWIPIVAIAIILDDWAKYILSKGERPRYIWK